MLKLIIFFVFTIILSLGASWFLDNNGDVSMAWLGYQIDTTIMFLVGSIALIFISIILFFYLIKSIITIPKRFSHRKELKKSDLAIKSLTRTIAAIEMGDVKLAKLSMKETKKLYNGKENIYPLIHLLEANLYSIKGEFQLANEHYNALLENKDTELVALHGLLKQASDAGDYATAIALAEKAAQKQPKSIAVTTLLLGLYKKACIWDKYDEQLEKYKKILKKVKKDEKPLNWEREKALALYMTASLLLDKNNYDNESEQNNDVAYKLLIESNKYDKSFLPTAILLVNLAEDNGNKRKASLVIEQLWKINPYCELGEKYISLYHDDNPKKRLKKANKLLSLNPDNYIGNLLVAKEMIANDRVEIAKEYIEKSLEKKSPESKLFCELMIKIKQAAEKQNPTEIKSWETKLQYAPKNSIWKCKSCGDMYDEWAIKCNNCEAIDNIDIYHYNNEGKDKSILSIS